jgi:dTDP-4-amino-4,6-dideoxygalactose transaminase
MLRFDNSDPELMAELMQAVRAVAERAAFIHGEDVEAFESEFAAYCGTSHAIGVSSGTEALALALRALGVGAGDEVIVPANSFVATAEAVTLTGATPIFVDVHPATQLVSAELIEPAIGPRTRAVIPVHLYGRTVELDTLVALAHEKGLAVIEDACQAHGARYRGRRVGSVGDCGCFSFYPSKNLGAWGDGGAVVTSDSHLADRVRLLRSHGERPRYRHRLPGTTARLDTIQAAILRLKLRRLDSWNAARRRLAKALDAALRSSSVELPAPRTDGHDHVFHQYVVQTEQRDSLRAHLEKCGVASSVHYPQPIHLSEAYARRWSRSLPVAERLAGRICSVPLFPSMTDSELERVASAVDGFTRTQAFAAA